MRRGIGRRLARFRWLPVVWLCVVATATAGCGHGLALQQIEVDRVDQDLTAGNRGYLIGQPPPAPARRTTRPILELEIPLGTAEEVGEPVAAPAAPQGGAAPAAREWSK